jgi:hypothetical protein
VKKTTIALLALSAIATPAIAFHRQTPPVVPITLSGDTPLPRLGAGFERLVAAIGSPGSQVFLCRHRHRDGIVIQQISTDGSNDNPTIAPRIGNVIAWDADCDQIGCADPGRQIFEWAFNHGVFQVTHDPSGTSVNPTLGGQGNTLAWESTGDLANTLNAGVRQIFLRGADGIVIQVSRGNGTSRNPSLDRSGRYLAYESTNDFNGNDTNISQIWLLSADGSHTPITSGDGSSRNPMMSPVGRLTVFESTAALTSDGHDTTVSQVFVYEARTQTLTQVSDDPLGCSGASVARGPGDWNIGYICHGEAFFHTLLGGHTFRLPIPGTDTQQAIAGFGVHFMTASTKAHLLADGTSDGTTLGHQIYLLNLYKLKPEQVE